MAHAPPVAKDGFAYTGGDFFAEASGHNRHRRAAPAEIDTHFKSGSDKDHTAHWFEAQLIHYGLQPSKTKAVARMRLFDALKAGKLTIPTHIKKLEAELKKEWTKHDREAKKALKETASASSAPATAARGTKRKTTSPGSEVDVTINLGGVNVTISAKTPTESPAKKARTTKATAVKAEKATTKAVAVKAEKATTKTTKAMSATALKAAAKTAAAKTPKEPAPKRATAAKPKTVPVAPTSSISVDHETAAASTEPRQPRTKQTARRGRPFTFAGRIPAPIGLEDNSAPPPAYTMEATQHSQALRPLGLLNGRYDLTSDEVKAQWDFDDEDFSLVLTLSGSEIWGKFELGIISGIMRIPQRPFASSYEQIPFRWRGREDQGPIMYGDDNTGWIKFLGDGRVVGKLDYMSVDFRGVRVPGQGTRSEIQAAEMQSEWSDYSYERYEEERVSRWG
ncbi:hypothetical protein BC832DRAFT_3225 [Gaertneriomyces semiglobifer]|nr:hypothetical protein BC832DRAFT_3225 [Gaertneriomyces semiglobifer]